MADGLERYLVVAVGSAAGGCARYALGSWIASRAGASFPWGTLVVNVTGCFVVGLFLTTAADRLALDPRWRLLVVTGFCSGYTTFSTLAYDTSKLLEARSAAFATANVVGSFAAGLVALRLGAALGGRS
jgi:fluoride exporter